MIGGIAGRCSHHGGKPICNEEGCTTPIRYYKNGLPGKCGIHGGVPRCKYNNISLCGLWANIKFDDYCFRCFCYLHPDNPIVRNFKTKENRFTDEIKDYFNENEFDIDFDEPLYDKIVPDGCSKRRPDVFIDLYTHIIILECDENAHDNLEYSCETLRTCQLYKDCNYRPIVFIRFNPDAYKDVRGKTHKSCFSPNMTSSTIKCNQIEWDRRMKIVLFDLYYNMRFIPKKAISIVYIFYGI